MVYWEVSLATYPRSEYVEDTDLQYEARILASGFSKLKKAGATLDEVLVAGKDYEVKRNMPEAPWVPLPENEYTK